MKVKLIKGLSYMYNGVNATKDKPIECTKAEGDYLIGTGRFTLVEDTSDNEGITVEKALEKMTKSELTAYAAENGIDVTGCEKKEEILATIKSAGSDDETYIEV